MRHRRLSVLDGGVAVALLWMTAACAAAPSAPWRETLPSGSALKGAAPILRAGVETVNPDYDRLASSVMVRRVDRPTRANLDYAAYIANVMLRRLDPDAGEVGGARGPAAEALFGGMLEGATMVDSLASTPLSAEARESALAFVPLTDYLARWDEAAARGLLDLRAAVRMESWGGRTVPGLFTQEITQLFIESRGARDPDYWVEIEFQPWARPFDPMPDANGDGVSSIYARLRVGLVPAEVHAKIEQDYAGAVLDEGAVRGWANELASYWYPSYNTDVVTEMSSLRAQLRAKRLAGAAQDILEGEEETLTVALRGKPHGKAIYNVILVHGVRRSSGSDPATGASDGPVADLSRWPVSPSPSPTAKAIAKEASEAGGWAAWARRMADLHGSIRRMLERRPQKLHALIGEDGFLFYRRSLETIIGGDIRAQPRKKNPFAAIVAFKDFLAARNVDFLLVPVPAKAEVFADKLGTRPTLPAGAVIHPFGRKFLMELARAGVEVVDLLPTYLAARSAGDKGKEPIYQRQDTHWSARGIGMAAEMIAQRIKAYPWYEAWAEDPVDYGLKRVTFVREGDLHSRLAAHEQDRFPPRRLVGLQVLEPTGEPYEDDPRSPVVVLGDSFTGVYQRTDCRHAGISAHIAREVSRPIDLVMSYGGGPNVRTKLLRRGEEALRQKRLVVWVLAARDFFNYWDDWAALKETARSSGDSKR